MSKTPRLQPSDLAGFSGLGIEAVTGLADLVEAMHATITQRPEQRTDGITGLVYQAIRGTTQLVGGGINAALELYGPAVDEPELSPEREAMLAAVNGAWGDHLVATGNPLAIPMRLRSGGRPLQPGLGGGKLLILAHGLCMNDLQWTRKGHDHGAALAHDLGFTPIYLHYNSGLHVSTNGRAFANVLETLVAEWPTPVEEIVILGHSMGGLVARSAVHYGTAARQSWTARLRKIVFLGTPHHGSPLERIGNLVDMFLEASRYSAPLARPGKTRSVGITDLRYGNLLDEECENKDAPRPVPLPEDVACYAIAGVASEKTAGAMFDDLLVPLDSALGRHKDQARTLRFAEDHQWIAQGVNHFDLLSDESAYDQMRTWLTK
jgi:pimeloyl-ACP methyl ester carboxylesterase